MAATASSNHRQIHIHKKNPPPLSPSPTESFPRSPELAGKFQILKNSPENQENLENSTMATAYNNQDPIQSTSLRFSVLLLVHFCRYLQLGLLTFFFLLGAAGLHKNTSSSLYSSAKKR
ncbi:hypothetical protein HanPI659440_Chr05g0210911 [Helianthus annuus]|nr:hypothetical protein HanPI659440_Chr05g0210911 [Helianthus annuus]